ncbi:uncharacterized protein LOC125663628 [Ostrea edulis]|uniref:uncharacterized protein LOC125663628 n=1 Tax=Ostrea edulis TaxID=37623 RepID=UPI0024AEEC34|nr:uncharacterized protein LOC125663628 [Ostrea edulis]
MVKHCSHGTCKSDSKYPEKLVGGIFIPFPKPKSDFDRCLCWISLCRRSHSQLNVDKITKHTYLCSKVSIILFHSTEEYPDPCDAQTGELQRARRNIRYMDQQSRSVETSIIQNRVRQLDEENTCLRQEIEKKNKLSDAACQTERNRLFNAGDVSKSKIKNLFKFYTELTYARFVMLLTFLFPNSENPIMYEDKRKEVHVNRFPLSQHVFMYLCKLRNGLNVKD